jgi:hypothetical protein
VKAPRVEPDRSLAHPPRGLHRVPRGLNLQVPRGRLPAEEWLTIQSIVRDLELEELEERDWNADLLAGYFCQSLAPWKR